MYAERETGGLGRDGVIEEMAKRVRDAEGPQAADGRDRQGQEEPDKEAKAPIQLPARIAVESPSPQAPSRSPRARKLALLGAAVLLAVGTAGTFGYRWWT